MCSAEILPIKVYGPENVSSGASSDIQNATHTALRMVKYFGFSSLGPVLYDDSQRKISPERTLEIEDEVAKCVTSAIVYSCFLDLYPRLVRGGEADAFTLLKGRMDELHRVRHGFGFCTLNSTETLLVSVGPR